MSWLERNCILNEMEVYESDSIEIWYFKNYKEMVKASENRNMDNAIGYKKIIHRQIKIVLGEKTEWTIIKYLK
jgi:hypothetical protein